MKIEKLKIERKGTKSNQNISEEEILFSKNFDHKTDLPYNEDEITRVGRNDVLILASNASSLPGNGAKNLMDRVSNSFRRVPKT